MSACRAHRTSRKYPTTWTSTIAAFVRDPFAAYDRLRRDCPLARSNKHGGFWLMTRYEDVRAAAINWRDYTSSVAGVTAIPVITPRTEPMLPIEIDPPRHSRYRALVNPVFAPERVDGDHAAHQRRSRARSSRRMADEGRSRRRLRILRAGRDHLACRLHRRAARRFRALGRLDHQDVRRQRPGRRRGGEPRARRLYRRG